MAGSSNVNQSKRYLYHYTNREGIEGIKDSEKIYPSTDTVRDAMLGEAVYLTDVAPCNRKDAILKNNYGSNPRRYKQDRADYYVKIPRDSISTLKADGNRVIYRSSHDRRPLDLRKIDDVKVGCNGKWEIPIEHRDCIENALDEEEPSYGGSSYNGRGGNSYSWRQPNHYPQYDDDSDSDSDSEDDYYYY